MCVAFRSKYHNNECKKKTPSFLRQRQKTVQDILLFVMLSSQHTKITINDRKENIKTNKTKKKKGSQTLFHIYKPYKHIYVIPIKLIISFMSI